MSPERDEGDSNGERQKVLSEVRPAGVDPDVELHACQRMEQDGRNWTNNEEDEAAPG